MTPIEAVATRPLACLAAKAAATGFLCGIVQPLKKSPPGLASCGIAAVRK
jgi:hypothetical protein